MPTNEPAIVSREHYVNSILALTVLLGGGNEAEEEDANGDRKGLYLQHGALDAAFVDQLITKWQKLMKTKEGKAAFHARADPIVNKWKAEYVSKLGMKFVLIRKPFDPVKGRYPVPPGFTARSWELAWKSAYNAARNFATDGEKEEYREGGQCRAAAKLLWSQKNRIEGGITEDVKQEMLEMY